MSEPRRPDELDESVRRGASLRLEDGVYVPQRGLVPCAKCGETKPNLYGTPDAPLCTSCIGEIVGAWCTAHLAAQRTALGLDPL